MPPAGDHSDQASGVLRRQIALDRGREKSDRPTVTTSGYRSAAENNLRAMRSGRCCDQTTLQVVWSDMLRGGKESDRGCAGRYRREAIERRQSLRLNKAGAIFDVTRYIE